MGRFFIAGLKLTNKRVLVVGSGSIGMRKIKKLLPYKPNITVLSPNISDSQKKFFSNNNVKIIVDKYKKRYLKDFFLVIAATDNYKLNQKIFNDSVIDNILVNNVSDRNFTDLIFTINFRIKNFIVSFSTNGTKPHILKRIKGFLKCFISVE